MDTSYVGETHRMDGTQELLRVGVCPAGERLEASVFFYSLIEWFKDDLTVRIRSF
jgi:hypothetical protein